MYYKICKQKLVMYKLNIAKDRMIKIKKDRPYL